MKNYNNFNNKKVTTETEEKVAVCVDYLKSVAN